MYNPFKKIDLCKSCFLLGFLNDKVMKPWLTMYLPYPGQEATTTVVATAETKEPDELKEAPNDDDSDHDKVKETAGAEAELPAASTPAKVD